MNVLSFGFLVIGGVLANLDYLDVEVEFQCSQHCPLQNRTDAGHYDYACDYGCNIDQCDKGCKLWRKALNSSCQKVCNGPQDRLTPRELYCVMGCNDAMTKYFSQLKSKLLTPPAPALVADTLNATSLKLEWNFPEAKRVGLSQHVQWKYEELTAAWHYCRNASWSDDGTVVLIESLQPYTKYRFRIVLIFGHQENSIVSNPSVVISTLPSGIPVSPPSSVRVAPIDSTRISVSWEPGLFPHGPLLSYVLQITDNQPDAVVPPEVKDIPAEDNFYMFKNLRPSRNYTISIKMRNSVGSGPSAKVTVATPSEQIEKDTQQPVLILGTELTVIKQGTNIMDEPAIIYRTLMKIRGIAIHISKQLIFISDSGGHILRLSLSQSESQNISYILSPNQINFTPLELSVDWLNNQLYVLGEVKRQQQRIWQIARCDLDGRKLTIAVAGLRTEPHNIEVDPYNGYLFWANRDQGASIYRLDLSDISNGIKHHVQPVLILQDPNLGAFTVDNTNFRLFVANESQKTINSVSLDGKEILNVRPNVINSKLKKVLSLATAYKKFYWTDGDNIFFEEYHKSDYFHNSYPDPFARSYKKVIINLPSSQPIPSPVNPPTHAQAIFGSSVAKITWQAPHLLGIQGKGAWQNWSYEIAVKETNSEKFVFHDAANATSFKISGLNENTEYVIKVAAYTKSGKGPWSSEFRGVTLSKRENPVVYWSAAKGLLKSDATGENVETLIHKSRMKSFYFIDMTWFKELIYLVTNDSHVYWYNTKTHNQGQLIDVDSVGSIAVDWIGMKLYWSNPKRQMIIRGNLNGTQQEPLPILTLAKELNIDSVKAYLYWSTGFAVRCAHLNGENAIEYHPVQLFSGRQVMGLTLDINNKFVYWIVRGSEGSNLFRAPMAGYSQEKIVVEKISSLHKPNMQGPLCYFHNRLLWLQDEKNAAISDIQGKNIATISGESMSDLSLVYIVDKSLHVIPKVASNDEIVVIPESVNITSVRVIGSLNSFNISWEPITNVNYGDVFYEVSIDGLSRNDSSIITKAPTTRYWQQVAPFTKLQVAIRAFTYWGTSPQIRAEVNSPASTPSVPQNLRAFVNHVDSTNGNTATITVRWDPPMYPNGVIKGYKVHCWYYSESRVDLCKDTLNDAKNFEVEVKSVNVDQVYYFNVQAYNEVRNGDLSDTISVNANKEYPIPNLLVASSDSIYFKDVDTKKNFTFLQGINTPIQLGYLFKESKIFWINQLRDIIMYNLLTENTTKIVDLKKRATSLTVDWLERSIYFAQTENFDDSCIYKIDLNHFERGITKIKKIICTQKKISSIEVSPYTKKLYWVEKSKMMVCNTDGSNTKKLFDNGKNRKRSLNDCNCGLEANIEETFTLNHSQSDKNKPTLLFIDSDSQNIISSDKSGCRCNTITNVTLPVDKIRSDVNNVYWTQAGILHIFHKNTSLVDKSETLKDFVIYGQHIQPFPPKRCLKPEQSTNIRVALKQRTSQSLTIRLPEVSPICGNTSMPSLEYRIYCTQKENKTWALNYNYTVSMEKEYTIRNLKPFTNYDIFMSVTNFYTYENQIVLGPHVVLQTAVGAPTPPQNVTVTVLNPTMAKVTWKPPEEFNGATVHYEIYWQTERTLSRVLQKEQPLMESEFSNTTYTLSTVLNKLAPNKTYTIWVRAYSETNETYTDSDKVLINTYPDPNDLLLLNKSAYQLILSWQVHPNVENYSVQFSTLTPSAWTEVENIDDKNGEVVIVSDNLEPKTLYKFRLCLFFENHPQEYIWPQDSRFTFETLGDRPSRPGTPKIQYVKPNIYKVWWEPSKDNGAPIEMYKLEGLQLPNYRTKRSTNRTAFFYTAPSIEEEEREWQHFYNGTETSWIIDGLSEKYKYEFRVSALNGFGWSDPSDPSTSFDLNEAARMAEKQSPLTLIAVATFIPVSVFFIVLMCIVCRKYGKSKKVQVVSIPRGPDVELATLRELPRRGIHNTNVLYISTQPTNEELTVLPHIRRDQITLTKFLGSGAFGEVFEGKARGVNGSNAETKVAVKTLRKGASDQEKTEFLQEAQLMSNFKHEHILQLLGVCLDNDPHFIIMELMQGGDLLTYLRSSRNPNIETASLTLLELLKMCVDVAKGCRYLEELHFVHRDLACRNCLVSSKDTERIVKIGDFGLARDIYKNDYYRKEGEGLLPVRWMAPESLVDGVFTSQSDVWAFGVLLWEIMTLGQQPYPARNNLEVLHYVRGGGRLGKPTDCPENLHNLMLKCWEFEADKRPTFKYCLGVLESLHFQKLRCPTTGVHEGQYISTVQDYFEGISNEAYFRDENHNSADGEDETKEKTPFLATDGAAVPKYLELLYETDAPLNDGYEIPNQMLAECSRLSSEVSATCATLEGAEPIRQC